jgi:superfamily I DNA and/or RNA helicase
VAVQVPGHRSEGKKQNLVEAEYIVAALAACLEDPAYQGKTFGAISLLGEEQGKLIRALAAERLGISALENCGFLCGNPADFQGDERDIIFLSLVDSAPNDKEDKMLRLVG